MIKYPQKNFIFNIYVITDKIDTDKLKYQPDEVNQINWFKKEELIRLITEDKVLEPHKFILTEYVLNS